MDNYELGGDQFSQQGTLVGANTKAFEAAASNANGAANGFMGIGMMNMSSGGMVGGAAQAAFQNQGVTAQDLANNGAGNAADAASTGEGGAKFCPECGTATNGAKFCSNCGKQL